jgi:hypothetical protein
VLKNEGIFAKGVFFKKRSWDLFGACSMILITFHSQMSAG